MTLSTSPDATSPDLGDSLFDFTPEQEQIITEGLRVFISQTYIREPAARQELGDQLRWSLAFKKNPDITPNSIQKELLWIYQDIELMKEFSNVCEGILSHVIFNLTLTSDRTGNPHLIRLWDEDHREIVISKIRPTLKNTLAKLRIDHRSKYDDVHTAITHITLQYFENQVSRENLLNRGVIGVTAVATSVAGLLIATQSAR